MRFNQVLRATRFAASALFALVALLLAGAGLVTGNDGSVVVDGAGSSQDVAIWSTQLGDPPPPPPYYECWDSYGSPTLEQSCFAAARECSGTSEESCEGNTEVTQCHVEADAVKTVGEQGGAIRLQIDKNCTGTRLEFACVWQTWYVGETLYTACVATVDGSSINCLGTKNVKMKTGCPFEN